MTKTRGIIFNIQKFSLHDGPGIRTVVFFMGCPLHCPWCSNPESQGSHSYASSIAKECPKCYTSANLELLANAGNKASSNNTIKEPYYDTVDHIIEEVNKDSIFYSESGGGMTLSGGEVLQQPLFAMTLLKRAKELGIHTAAETTCLSSSKVFKKFLQNLDLLLCDIKHYDSDIHEKVIGAPLHQIIKNIKFAVKSGTECIARIPIIPGFNYEYTDAKNFCNHLKDMGIKKVNLLPYHNFGENKYKLLGLEYTLNDVDPVHKTDEKFIKYSQIFKDAGFDLAE